MVAYGKRFDIVAFRSLHTYTTVSALFHGVVRALCILAHSTGRVLLNGSGVSHASVHIYIFFLDFNHFYSSLYFFLCDASASTSQPFVLIRTLASKCK